MSEEKYNQEKASELLRNFEKTANLKDKLDDYSSISKDEIKDLIPDELYSMNKAMSVAKKLRDN